MVKIVGIVSLPVVFYDGEREISIGNAEIYQSLEFKRLQLLISQRIGVSPYQFSISLIRRNFPQSSMDKRRRFPITEKTDFDEIMKEEDSYFFVKRLKKERKGKRSRSFDDNGYSFDPIEIPPEKRAPPEKILLRRDPVIKPPEFGLLSPHYNQITSSEFLYRGMMNYENQLLKLKAQMERYLISTTNTSPYMQERYLLGRANQSVSTVVCQICSFCLVAKETPPSFHWCVYDEVTVGFRTTAGPIARPGQGSC